jgi:diguanylate cyclase (GGDEF)-like protein
MPGQTDAVARQGGDELTMLLAGAPLPEAQNLFGRLREEAAEYSEHELGFRFSLSAGAASFPSDGGDPNGLLEAADTAMYRAKRPGTKRPGTKRWGKDQLYYRFMDAG